MRFWISLSVLVGALSFGAAAFSPSLQADKKPAPAAKSQQSASPPGALGQPAAPAAAALPAASRADHELLSKAAHAFNDIATRSLPAVVSIMAIKVPGKGEMRGHGMPPGLGDPRAHRGMPGAGNPLEPGGEEGGEMMGLGSGVIVKPSGLILTNNHVVENASRIQVSLGSDNDKKKLNARIIGADAKTDLALIQLEGKSYNLPTLTLGNSDDIKVGDWAIAMGSPFGLRQSVTFGIISAKGRAQMGILDTEDFIQTDASINPGNSGGPLLNASGEVVGINTAIFSQDGSNVGIGFAVPAKIAREVSEQLLTNGRVIRGWIGVAAQDLDPDLARYFKAPAAHGALVSDVLAQGPAGQARLQSGDVVVKYGDHAVNSASELKSVVGKTSPGSKVPIEVLRYGQSQKLTLDVQEQPGAKLIRPSEMAGQIAKQEAKASGPPLGITVRDIPVEIARLLKLTTTQGALVTNVKAGSAAFDAGIAPGDIVLKANRVPVRNSREFQQAVKDMKQEEVNVFFLQRGPSERIYVPVKTSA